MATSWNAITTTQAPSWGQVDTLTGATNILLESGGSLLLESGGPFLLETAGATWSAITNTQTPPAPDWAQITTS